MAPANVVETGPHWPAEWEPQEAVWLSWPLRDDLWTEDLAELQCCFGRLAAVIANHAEVRINAVVAAHDRIAAQLREAGVADDRWRLFDHPTDDVWCRDHGPIFVRRADAPGLAVTDWQFNAWGGKFPPWDRDNEVPARVAESLSLPRQSSPLFLEGGAIEGNGDGLLITTEAVLLNHNRNPDWSAGGIGEELRRLLGVRAVFWLGQGLEGDDTDGHVDDMVRFVKHDAVVAVTERHERDPNHRILRENHERLQDLRTCGGSRVEVIDLPLPEPVASGREGWRLERLPASYANFLICNDLVLVPTFDQPRADDRGLGILRECFPRHQVTGFDARLLLAEGGAIHCVTQQQPASPA